MENLLTSTSITRRAFWLVELRWVAIAALVCATLAAKRLMGISLPSPQLYLLSGCALVYNILMFGLIKTLAKDKDNPPVSTMGHMITFQISADLVILTAILHFSGGIENPCLLFFVFHMIIASIVRSRIQSYMQATLAVVLFGGLILLECFGVVQHYSLGGFATPELYSNQRYVLSMLFVFAVTLYLIVYMTTSIVQQVWVHQESLAQANEQLEEKDKIKNQYVLRVTHDMKGHLGAIESVLETVDSQMLGPLNEKQQDMVGRAHRRATKCLAFVQALLKLTRMRLAGELPVTEFSLKGMLERALESVQEQANTKNITLKFEDTTTIDRFTGQPMMLGDALTNVLFNAIKYTPAGGTVTLKVTQDKTTFYMAIIDTGIGIPTDDLDHIFEEFYRASNARDTEKDGTGLGLSFAKSVAERHGGGLSVRNNEGEGCTFTFSVPLTKADA